MGPTSERFPLGLCGKVPQRGWASGKQGKFFIFIGPFVYMVRCLYSPLFSRVYRYTKAQLN